MTIKELKRLLNQFDDSQEVDIIIDNNKLDSDVYVVENEFNDDKISIMNDVAFEEYCRKRMRS